MKPITDLSVERVNNDQSALFNNPLNSAQILAGMDVFKISVPNGIEVGTFDNTSLHRLRRRHFLKLHSRHYLEGDNKQS